ncbi:hypothetical protein [Streptomyces sp. NBC_01803]|uniref:hypothetical protein n=1 Tax=Streptomyces sp. NBC_01803 TaxID=2975946 RepID=UPI002DDC3888|nr:hypothetical protein [Streptomyces sp. NBC_01803]WSA47798.1 hypothetical protein OIE51_07370 [Streptomyces sp. NBC_01803]
MDATLTLPQRRASRPRGGTARARARAQARAAGETSRREAAAALQRAIDRRDNGGADAR